MEQQFDVDDRPLPLPPATALLRSTTSLFGDDLTAPLLLLLLLLLCRLPAVGATSRETRPALIGFCGAATSTLAAFPVT